MVLDLYDLYYSNPGACRKLKGRDLLGLAQLTYDLISDAELGRINSYINVQTNFYKCKVLMCIGVDFEMRTTGASCLEYFEKQTLREGNLVGKTMR